MKSWQKRPDNVLLDSVKMTALMSFCFGIGLLASSVIGFGSKMQLAETISYSSTTSPTIGISGGVSSGDANNTNTQTTTTSPNTVPATNPTPNYIAPALTFVSAVPAVVTSDFTVNLNAVSVQNPRLIIRGLNINKIINLEPASQQSPIFNFLVRFEQLPVGLYEIVAKAYLPSGSLIEVVGPRFEILSPVINQTTNSNPSSGSSSTSTSVNSSTGLVSSSTSTTTDPVPSIIEEEAIPKLDLIIQNQSVYRGVVPVQVRTSVSLPEAFIYLQSANLSTPRFIGKARYYNSSTLMSLIDTNQIPNGEYRIYALAKLTDINVESERRRFVIDNSTTTNAVVSNSVASTSVNPGVVTQPIISPQIATIEPNIAPTAPAYVPPRVEPKEEVKTIKNTDNANVEPKNESTNSGSDTSPKPVNLSDTLKALIPQLLKEYEQEINDRLKVFGEDLHTIDEVEVSDLRKKAGDDLMSILLNDYRLRSISTEAKKRLRTEVERLVARAEKVELLIKKAEANSAGLDESINTFSETVIPAGDIIVDTTSPREFGLVREDILKIESVSPVVSVDVLSTTTKVYTEIKGRALPKSLVTLYIYSTPVMVTVRADADGTFLYVYEKDLEDGDHEVYVALTTTEGEVVVKSPSFQFIREAEAFTSPDAPNGDSLIPATAGTPLTKNPYFVVISITLLVISFVFFLLGFKVSKKSDDFTAV